jgi:predicted RNA polymerase sigma factor
VLVKLLGMEHIDMAEDIAGETFLTALETWPYKGVPENPTAWLYTVAKNKAKTISHVNIFLPIRSFLIYNMRNRLRQK